jgi:valyl-tRNA synthetase
MVLSQRAFYYKLYMRNLHPNETEIAIKYPKTAFPDIIPQGGTNAARLALVEYTTTGGVI